MTKIPSDEAFARAKARRKERDRNMGDVNHMLKDFFKKLCGNKAHNSHVIAEDDRKFRAYIFYKKNEDVRDAKESGMQIQLVKFVYDELERQGRGDKDSLDVTFEFDSHENVLSNFEGDYFLRLR